MNINLVVKPSAGIAGVFVGILCAGGVALYKHIKKNTEYKTEEVEGEVIEREERHTPKTSASINTANGMVNGSLNQHTDDDYYIQIKLDNGCVFTKHGLHYFDNYCVGQKVTVVVRHRFYKKQYRSTDYVVSYGYRPYFKQRT